MDDTQKRIDDLVKNNRVVLFMKGTAQFPMCGFSGAGHAGAERLRRESS